jgi:acetyl esterase/lipase
MYTSLSASMASTKHIVSEIPTYITLYSDGTVDRPRQAPLVPPNLDDPNIPVSSKDIIISQNPNISARLYLPKNPTEKLPILVFFHGGGFFFESAFSKLYHEHFNVFVSQANSIVVSVEYRLAPEHPLPACYNDCWNALQWVASNSAENPINPEPWLINHGDFNRVFIGGDSAGGNIVHNVAIRAGSESLPNDVKLLGAILQHPYFYSSYPVGSESVKLNSSQLDLFTSVWSFVYPSAPGGIDNPMVNPLGTGAPSLEGIGCDRMIVCVAGKDGIRERGVWYYEIVKKSGWKGKLELFEEKDEDHVYHIFHPESENGQKLIKRLASYLHE